MENYPDNQMTKVKFPKSLSLYNNSKDNLLNLNNEFVIVFIGYLDCNTCLIQMNKFNNLKSENPNIKIIYIGVGESTEYVDEMIKKYKYNYPIYQDLNGDFVAINNLNYEEKSIILLNREKRIILLGNPFSNPILKKYYLSFIN